MIPFNVPTITGNELNYMEEVIRNRRTCGDGPFTKKCNSWFEEHYGAKKALMTTSCTHALEMSAILLDISPGDEVIMPSYTFVSTANAFTLRGATIVFIDIDPETMNIDAALIEKGVTSKTRAIVPVHYAGIACDMDKILEISGAEKIPVVEDAAQGFDSRYRGRLLGGFGTFGCFSFHETKNISCGEGGMLLINDESFTERAEIIREKGTNRAQFIQGIVDKYTWVDVGSSYLPSEFNAGVLWSQIQYSEEIQRSRMHIWNGYHRLLSPLSEQGGPEIMKVPDNREHNAHMFYIKTRDINERSKLIEFLKSRGISGVFHYIPLHTSPFGIRHGRFIARGEDLTTRESSRLLRLPLWHGMSDEQIETVCEAVKDFYR